MFGSDDNLESSYAKQLSVFKNTLIPLYKQKTKLTSEREAFRFQYLTGMKVRLDSMFRAIRTYTYDNHDVTDNEILDKVLGFIQYNIPMPDFKMQTVAGWGAAPFNMGGPNSINLLSSTSDLLTSSMTSPEEEFQAAYKYLAQFMSQAQYQSPDYYLNDYFVFGSGYPLMSNPNGERFAFEIPITFNWLTGVIPIYPDNYTEARAAYQPSIDWVNSVLARKYNGITLNELLLETRDLLYRIIELTIEIIDLQMTIDAEEASLASYVSEVAAYSGDTRSLAEILKSIRDAADQAEVAVITSEIPQPDLESDIVIMPSPKKSNSLLLLGGAVAAALFLGRDK